MPRLIHTNHDAAADDRSPRARHGYALPPGWLRDQHQLVFPEGMIVLNETSTAIVRLCDGRSPDDLIATLKDTYPGSEPTDDVYEFLRQLADRGLLRDGSVD